MDIKNDTVIIYRDYKVIDSDLLFIMNSLYAEFCNNTGIQCDSEYRIDDNKSFSIECDDVTCKVSAGDYVSIVTKIDNAGNMYRLVFVSGDKHTIYCLRQGSCEVIDGRLTNEAFAEYHFSKLIDLQMNEVRNKEKYRGKKTIV